MSETERRIADLSPKEKRALLARLVREQRRPVDPLDQADLLPSTVKEVSDTLFSEASRVRDGRRAPGFA